MTEETNVSARADLFVSVVAVLDPSMTSAVEFLAEVEEAASSRYVNYEIILVANGSTPDLVTELRDTLVGLPCTRVLRLSRQFSSHSAMFAGIEAAIGDYVVVMSATHDPTSVVAGIVDILIQGEADVVQGVSTSPMGGPQLGRKVFYWYNRRFLGVDIPARSTALLGMTRRAVNTLTASSRSHRYLRHLVRYVGYRIAEFDYETMSTMPERRFRDGLVEAVEMVSSYSVHPLRVVTLIGAAAALVNLLYAIYVLVASLAFDVVEGWTTSSLQMSLMFFVICVILAVQSEYLGRVLTETRKEPSYVIMEELESEIQIPDAQRRNVSK